MGEPAVRAFLRRAASRVFHVPPHALPWLRAIQDNASRGAEAARLWLEATDRAPQVELPLAGLLNDGIPSRTESVVFLSDTDVRVRAPSPPPPATARRSQCAAVCGTAPVPDRRLSPAARLDLLGYLGEVRLVSILCQLDAAAIVKDDDNASRRRSRCRLHVSSDVLNMVREQVYRDWSVPTLRLALEMYCLSPSVVLRRVGADTLGQAATGSDVDDALENELLVEYVADALATQAPFMTDGEFRSYAAVSRRLMLSQKDSNDDTERRTDAANGQETLGDKGKRRIGRRNSTLRSFLKGCRLRALVCRESDEAQRLLADSVKAALVLGESAAISSVLSAFPADEWFLILMQAAATTVTANGGGDDGARSPAAPASEPWRWGPVQVFCCGALALGAHPSQVPLRRRLGQALTAPTAQMAPATVDDELARDAGSALLQVLLSPNASNDDDGILRSEAERERRELLVQLRTGMWRWQRPVKAAASAASNATVGAAPQGSASSSPLESAFRAVVLQLRMMDCQRGDLLRDAFRLVLQADTLTVAVAMVGVASRHYSFLCYCLWFRIVSVLLPEAVAMERRAVATREEEGELQELPRGSSRSTVIAARSTVADVMQHVSACLPLSEWLSTLLQCDLEESPRSTALLREAARVALRASDASTIADFMTRLDQQFSAPLPLSAFRFLGLLIEVAAHDAATDLGTSDAFDDVHGALLTCAARLQTGGCLRRHAMVLSVTLHRHRLVQSTAMLSAAAIRDACPPAAPLVVRPKQPTLVGRAQQRALARLLFELTEFMGSNAETHNVLRASMQSLRSTGRLDTSVRPDAVQPMLSQMFGTHHTRVLVLVRASSPRLWVQHLRRIHDAWRTCSSPWFDIVTLLQHQVVGDGLALRTHRLLLAERWLSSASMDTSFGSASGSAMMEVPTRLPSDVVSAVNGKAPNLNRSSNISATEKNSDEEALLSAAVSNLERILGGNPGDATQPDDTAVRLREVVELLGEFSERCGLADRTSQLTSPAAVLEWSVRGLLTIVSYVARFVARLADIDENRNHLPRHQPSGFASQLHFLFAPASISDTETLSERQRGFLRASQLPLDSLTAPPVGRLPGCVADVVRFEQAVDRVLLLSHPADVLTAYRVAASLCSLPPLANSVLGRVETRAALMPAEGHDRAWFRVESARWSWLQSLEILSLWLPKTSLDQKATNADLVSRSSDDEGQQTNVACDAVLTSLLRAMSKQSASHLAVTFVRSGKGVPQAVQARLRERGTSTL